MPGLQSAAEFCSPTNCLSANSLATDITENPDARIAECIQRPILAGVQLIKQASHANDLDCANEFLEP